MKDPYIQVPAEIEHIFGPKDEGTRIYRTDGNEAENAIWFEAVNEVAGSVVSPGGAGMFAPVSRAAVHERMKEGKLTAFFFTVKRESTNIMGRPRESRGTPFIFIPVSELKAWAEEIKERAIKRGKVTREELEGEKPDWEGDFLKWRNKDKRPTLQDFLKEEGLSVMDLARLILSSSDGLPPKPKGRKKR